MGTDQDTQRKHRRSTSDDEAEKSSKRHKHRHHHHRHRHHRSRKHEDETSHGGDDVAPSLPVINSCRIDDDVEEGEILEEDNFETKKLDSSEIKADLLDGVDSRIPEVGEFDHVKETPPDKIDDDLLANSGISEKIHNDLNVNGDFPHDYSKDIDRQDNDSRLRESVSPSRKSRKQKTYFFTDGMEDDASKLRERRKSLSSESSGDRHKPVVRSPSRDRSNDGFHARRSRSRSQDLALERARSQSIMEEETIVKRRHRHDWGLKNSEDKRVIQHSRNERHGSKDLVRDEEREHSSSYSSRHISREDRYHSREIQDGERSWERETEKDRRREKERESSRNMETNKERRRDKERESRDRQLYTEREERGRDRYEEVDRDGKRKKERDRSRDRARVSDREIDRHGERGRDGDKARAREHDLERERERRSDRSQGKAGGIESHMEKYASFDDSYKSRDKFKHSRHLTHDDDKGHFRDRTRRDDPAKAHSSNSHCWEAGGDGKTRDEDDFEERVGLKLVEQEEDLDRIKEESRKRRQAILDKYKNQKLQQHSESNSADVEKEKKSMEHPGLLSGADNNFSDNHNDKSNGVDGYIDDQLFSVRKSPLKNGITASDRTSGPGGLGDGTPKSETSDVVFCDDIFGETPVGVRKLGKAEGSKIIRSGLHDNWDDAEGYYSYRFGELLDARYEVTAAHGKGVFSTVVRAKDLKSGTGEPEEVAIKIIRNNETMNKAGQTEVQILKKLAGADPENKRHCVRFISNFKYRNHLCLVFESLHMNLREVLKKFGRNIGLKLTAVRAYAKQLFIALKHLKNCGVLHCDIKPDNMLVNEAKNVLKLCDFGNAMFAGKNEITPYLVSRFYRAPEIILGLPYDHPLDIWSVGCCLYELYTGKVLFPGATNNDMLRLHMELKGPFPKKMLRKGAFTEQHFDQDLNFHATEEDPVTKKTIKRTIFNIKPKDIGSIVTASPGEDPKMLSNFKDLLEKIFVLDPEKRMTVAQALAHPFISGK